MPSPVPMDGEYSAGGGRYSPETSMQATWQDFVAAQMGMQQMGWMAGSIVHLPSYVPPSDCICNCTMLTFYTLSPMRFAALAYHFCARCRLLVTETGTPWFAVASAAIHVYNLSWLFPCHNVLS